MRGRKDEKPTSIDVVKEARRAVREAVMRRIDDILDDYSRENFLTRSTDDVVDDLLGDLGRDTDERHRGARARGGADLKKQLYIAGERARALSIWLATFMDDEPNVVGFRRRRPGLPVPTGFSDWYRRASRRTVAALDHVVAILRDGRRTPWSVDQTRLFVVARAIPFVPPVRGTMVKAPFSSVGARRLQLDIDPSLPPDVVAALLGKIKPKLARVRHFPPTDAFPRFLEFVWQRWDPDADDAYEVSTKDWTDWNRFFDNAAYESWEGFQDMTERMVDWVVNVLGEEIETTSMMEVTEAPAPDFVLDADGNIGTLDSVKRSRLRPIRYPPKKTER